MAADKLTYENLCLENDTIIIYKSNIYYYYKFTLSKIKSHLCERIWIWETIGLIEHIDLITCQQIHNSTTSQMYLHMTTFKPGEKFNKCRGAAGYKSNFQLNLSIILK